MAKLTARQCDGAKPRAEKYMLADGAGLWLCVRPTGSKTWVSRVERMGRVKQVVLGRYPGMSLADARRLHATTDREAVAESMAFGEAFDRWLAHYAKTPSTRTRRVPTDETIDKINRRHRLYLSSLSGIDVDAITRPRVVALLDGMSDKPEEARQCFNHLRVFFEWAALRGMVEHSPLASIRAGSIGLTSSRPAGRVLTMDELRVVFDTADGIAGQALRIIILTGLRPGEVAGLRHDEFDGYWINIDAERMKSRKPHSVYAKPIASEILRTAGLCRVFLLATGHGRHVRRDSLTTYAARLAKSTRLDHFSPHDLRRSAATHWGELLGAPPHIVERMLAHAPENKLHAVYQRGEFRDEMSRVWTNWALEFLDQRIDVAPVIPLAPWAE